MFSDSCIVYASFFKWMNFSCSINNEAQSVPMMNLQKQNNTVGFWIMPFSLFRPLKKQAGIFIMFPIRALQSQSCTSSTVEVYLHISIMAESGECSVAWNTLFPQITALVWACELIQYWILCLHGESEWLGSRELGQKTASSLFWYCCLFRASRVFAVKVGLVNQYDSSVPI